MNEKRFTPLMGIHLIMMVVLAIMSIVTAIILLVSVGSKYAAELAMWKTSIVSAACFNAISAAALIVGVIYLLKGYRKNAAFFYKAFILLSAAATALCALTIAFVMQTGNTVDGPKIASTAGYVLGIGLMGIKVVLLLILTFEQDLGKRNSWTIFGVILACDLIVGLLFNTSGSWAVYRIVSLLPMLFVTGTIGLAIKGKYDDKDARGTI